MAKHTGISMVHVPYRGSSPGMADLLAGRVDLMFDYSIVAKPQIEGGKLRALAQTGAARMVSHPDVPTFADLGYPDVQFAAWATLHRSRRHAAAGGRQARERLQRGAEGSRRSSSITTTRA